MGCEQHSRRIASAHEAEHAPYEEPTDSKRRRTTVYTTDGQRFALREDAALAAAFVDTRRGHAELAHAARRLDAHAAADFYQFATELAQTRVVPTARSVISRRPIPCVFSTDGDTVRRERELALQLNAMDRQLANRLLREYDEALASAPAECRLLAGRSIAVLRSADVTERTGAHELAIRRLLELGAGEVAPSRLMPVDLYATIAQYFADRDDTVSAIVALEYALNRTSDNVDPKRRNHLAKWQEHLLASSGFSKPPTSKPGKSGDRSSAF
jgi:hypothetical protein